MPKIVKVSDPHQVRVIENNSADSEKLKASLDYVAMMADVELPDNETSNEVDDAQPEI